MQYKGKIRKQGFAIMINICFYATIDMLKMFPSLQLNKERS
jgi:hypothetical protein